MRPSRRSLLLPVSVIFSDPDRSQNDRPDEEALGTRDFPASTPEENRSLRCEWNDFVQHCETLLKGARVNISPDDVEAVALSLAAISENCYRAGLKAGSTQRWLAQCHKARAGKRRKADERGRILRNAIASVCERLKVTPVASEKFALSIRVDVIKAAEEFGLAELHAGTSPRSIQRHIALLLKATRI